LALEAESKNEWKAAGDRWREHAVLLDKAGNPMASEGFRRALGAYQRGGHAALISEVALERARSLSDDRPTERGPLFLEAATYAEEQKDFDRALTALRCAIRDGEGLRQSGLRGLGGQPIVAWLADCYLRTASVHKELGRFHEAALAAREAAGLWRVARQDADETQKRLFAGKSDDALAAAHNSFIRAGDMESAGAVRKQLHESLKGSVRKFKETWSGTVDLLKGLRSDALVGVALEYAEVVRFNGEDSEALRFLREQAEWCGDQGLDRQARSLLTRLSEYADHGGYFGEAAWALSERGTLERDMGLPLEAA
jgi:tetratricopeptide (TPR) repeat protein